MTTGYTISIKVADHATRQINAINKRLAAARAPFERVNKAMHRFSDLSGLKRVAHGFRHIAHGVMGVFRSITRVIPAFGILTGAASIAGLFRLTQSVAALSNELENNAAQIGTTPKRLMQLQTGAKLAGFSAQSMTSSVNGLGQALQGGVAGHNLDLVALFQKYAPGVNIHASKYQAKGGAEMMSSAFHIIKKMKEARVSAAEIQKAMSVMGLSPDMTRYAEQGAAGLKKYNAEALKYNTLSNKQIGQSADLYHSMMQVESATNGLANSIAAAISPALTPLLHQFADWIAANKAWIATKAAQYAHQFALWIKSIDWKHVAKSLKHFVAETKQVIKELGGFKRVSEVLLGVWAGSKVLGMIGAISRVAGLLAIPGVAEFLGIGAVAAVGFAGADQSATTTAKAVDAGLTPGMIDDNGNPIYFNTPDGKMVTPHEVETGKIPKNYGPNGPGPAFDKPLNPAQRLAAAHHAYNFWTKVDHQSPIFAAAMVAQEMRESGGQAGARDSTGQFAGLFQWSKPRRDAILKATGHDVWHESADKQLKDAAWELRHSEKLAAQMIARAKTYRQGGARGSLSFERPTDQFHEAEVRGKLAKYYGDLFGPSDPAAAATPTGQAPSPPIDAQAPSANPPAAPAAAPTGHVEVTIRHHNTPVGTSYTAVARGSLIKRAPLIVGPMASHATN